MTNELQKKIDEILAKYKPELDQLTADGRALEDDAINPDPGEAAIGIDFHIDWKDHDFSFDFPTITMKTESVSFDVPQVTMKLKKISWDEPYTDVGSRCVARAFGGCIARVPEIKTGMRRKEIKIHIPTLVHVTEKIKIDIPELGTSRQEIVIRLPEVTVTNINIKLDMMKKEGEKLQKRGKDISSRMKAEIDRLISGEPIGDSLTSLSSREKLENLHDLATDAFSATIVALKEKGVDPIKAPAEGGNINVRKQLEDAILAKAKALEEFDKKTAGDLAK